MNGTPTCKSIVGMSLKNYPGTSTSCDTNCVWGSIDQRPCYGDDWRWGSSGESNEKGGCISQDYCSELDTTVCPLFWTDTKHTSNITYAQPPRWTSRQEQANHRADGRGVTCTYPRADVKAEPAVQQQMLAYFGDQNDDFMADYCFAPQTEGCVIDSTTGKPLTSCSNLNTSSAVGTACRAWLSRQPAGVRDALMVSYCSTPLPGSDSPTADCRCIAAGKFDTNYAQFAKQAFGNTACWYLPCSSLSASSQLIPSTDVPKDCPDVCQIVNQFINNSDFKDIHIRNNISCKETGGGGHTKMSPLWAAVAVLAVCGIIALGFAVRARRR